MPHPRCRRTLNRCSIGVHTKHGTIIDAGAVLDEHHATPGNRYGTPNFRAQLKLEFQLCTDVL